MDLEPKQVEQIFTEQVMPRMEAGGFPIDEALAQAQLQQAQGTEGITFSLGREDRPDGKKLERLDMQIRGEDIVFGLGRVGPLEITIGAVQQILEDRKANHA